jgi:hypothetical protein
VKPLEEPSARASLDLLILRAGSQKATIIFSIARSSLDRLAIAGSACPTWVRAHNRTGLDSPRRPGSEQDCEVERTDLAVAVEVGLANRSVLARTPGSEQERQVFGIDPAVDADLSPTRSY